MCPCCREPCAARSAVGGTRKSLSSWPVRSGYLPPECTSAIAVLRKPFKSWKHTPAATCVTRGSLFSEGCSNGSAPNAVTIVLASRNATRLRNTPRATPTPTRCWSGYSPRWGSAKDRTQQRLSWFPHNFYQPFRRLIADKFSRSSLGFARVPRRQFTGKPTRSTAADEFPQHYKSVELENRVARLEMLITDLRLVCDEQRRISVALRAQLDHLMARVTGV